ncbi:phage head-tail adapter protein [Ruminococcus sp.]|uniref:phage head-tail adapter protein n=1 Tax=Ruminococcus sp. TaxID=41978 RepID=UPI0025D4A49C|nr:phage head-tail adapter protein [Ruminococcus sp.]
MNKEWSELNKTFQLQLKKEETYKDGIATLLKLREKLMQVMEDLKSRYTREEFNAIPFINADGYHSKTMAYSIWHIFRIEDITANMLIADDDQVFFAGDYKERINSPIITTGNELVKEQISDFSKQLNLDELYLYAEEVKSHTESMLNYLSYDSLKKKVSYEMKEKLKGSKVVSEYENAVWLIDYWCGKDIRGLIQMPFSRHWIMHTEACLRIADKLDKQHK